VDVIDSRTFLDIVSVLPSAESKVAFKKNVKAAVQKQEAEEEHWYVNEEDRLFRGPDFVTRDEDLLKLVKHMRLTFGKGDFYRYETDADFEIRSLVFSTEAMKERYLIYRDVVALWLGHPPTDARFRLSGVCLYGVNSNGRNVIFGIGLGKWFFSMKHTVNLDKAESLEFVLREFFYYMGKLPKALVLESPVSDFLVPCKPAA